MYGLQLKGTHHAHATYGNSQGDGSTARGSVGVARPGRRDTDVAVGVHTVRETLIRSDPVGVQVRARIARFQHR